MLNFIPPLGVLARAAVVLLVVAAIGGFLVAWSGFYSVAASRGHWPGVEPFLKFGMRSSVRTHALGIRVPTLEDENSLRRGAAHFQQGCAPCHGSPAGPSMQVVRTMLPEPSDLKALVQTWKANELFWIVKNGLKYTGMPAWPTQERDDEVWDMVTFLRKLPDMAPTRYRELAGLNADGTKSADLIYTCARCHGTDGRGHNTKAFPRLDLQTEEHLFAQMQAYASGQRPSGVMQTATAELTTANMTWLARHYASAAKKPDGQAAPAFDPAGEEIFLRGAPEQGVPACIACHAPNAAERDRAYPALLGQHAGYLEAQLALYRDGKRRRTAEAQLMSTVANRMTDAQIQTVVNYLSAQPPGATGR